MERSTPLLKHKKQEWDHRFAQEGLSKQELPQPLRLRTMNGSAVKSTFEHLGTQTNKSSVVKSTSSQSTVSTREKDHKRSGPSAQSAQFHTVKTLLEIDDKEFLSTAFNLAVKSSPSIEASVKNDRFSSSFGDHVSHGEHLLGDQSTPFRGPFTQSALLEIDISSSLQTLDKDDEEMRKEISDISFLNLSDCSGEHGGGGGGGRGAGRGFSYHSRSHSSGSNREGAAKPLCRLEVIGRGSSATIYRAVHLKSLSLCAEKVITVTDPSKRLQMMSELQSLKRTVRDRNGQSRCENIIGLLDIVCNPSDGTISICLEYMSGE